MRQAAPYALCGLTRDDRSAGFTILELIIVVAIIGILATIAMPQLRHAPTRAKEAALKTDLHTFREVIDQFYADQGHYPPTLEVLADRGYLRKIPVDPFTKSDETWELIYEDETLDPAALAEDPLTGEVEPGIIDVRSGSDQVSLDGTPYAEW